MLQITWVLQFRIAKKILVLQPCGRCATGFLQILILYCPLSNFGPCSIYFVHICANKCCQTVSNTVKWHWLYQELEEVTVRYSCYLSFVFESGFSFRDLWSLHWIGSTLVIDQNRSSGPKLCDYRYLSFILTNRLISIE